MFRALRRRALSALAATGAIAVAGAGIGASSARASSSGPLWQSAQAYSNGLPVVGSFNAASCPSAGNCLAVGALSGAGGSTTPLLAASSNDAWGQGETTTVSGVDTADGAEASVACMSASSCVGVGFNEDGSNYVPLEGSIGLSGSTVSAGPLIALALPSTPAPALGVSEAAALASVSCTASDCTAVGYYKTDTGYEEPMVASSAGGWSLSSVGGPSAAVGGANLTAVSCPSDGPCEAVGNYIDSSADLQSWAVQLAGTETPQTITPPPMDAVPTGGSLQYEPLTLFSLADGPTMGAISCPSVGACTAVGSYATSTTVRAMAVAIGNGAVGAVTPLTGPTGEATLPTGIFCADATDCTLNGDVDSGGSPLEITPVTAYESAGGWSALTALPGHAPVGNISLLSGLACSSLDDCLSVGYAITDEPNTPITMTPTYAFSAGPLSLVSVSLPAATVGQSYSAALQSSGGVGAGSWTVTNGALPAGLSLNPATGVISGTPTTAGTASFTVQLADGPPAQTASASLSIAVAAAAAPPAPPAPPAAPAAAPQLSAGAARVTANGVRLPIGCAGSGTCSGKAVLRAVEHLSGTRPTAVTPRAKHRRRVSIILARGSYSLGAGQLGSVNLKLTTRARALLKRLHRISGRLTLTPAGASTPTVTRTVTFKSRVKKRRRALQG